jgi:hypothetical protein
VREELKEEDLAASALPLVGVWALSPDLRGMAYVLRLRPSSRRPTSSASACLRRIFLLIGVAQPSRCLFDRYCSSLYFLPPAAQVQVLQAAFPCQESWVRPSVLRQARR